MARERMQSGALIIFVVIAACLAAGVKMWQVYGQVGPFSSERNLLGFIFSHVRNTAQETKQTYDQFQSSMEYVKKVTEPTTATTTVPQVSHEFTQKILEKVNEKKIESLADPLRRLPEVLGEKWTVHLNMVAPGLDEGMLVQLEAIAKQACAQGSSHMTLEVYLESDASRLQQTFASSTPGVSGVCQPKFVYSAGTYSLVDRCSNETRCPEVEEFFSTLKQYFLTATTTQP